MFTPLEDYTLRTAGHGLRVNDETTGPVIKYVAGTNGSSAYTFHWSWCHVLVDNPNFTFYKGSYLSHRQHVPMWEVILYKLERLREVLRLLQGLQKTLILLRD